MPPIVITKGSSPVPLEILVVGGGGAGGDNIGGGGGGGQVLTTSGLAAPVGVGIAVVVGAGGPRSGGAASYGFVSKFSSIVAFGGGPGGEADDVPKAPNALGSAGGTGGNSSEAGGTGGLLPYLNSSETYSLANTHDGGSGGGSSLGTRTGGGGGGGGAGGNGINGVPNTAGSGGVGVQWTVNDQYYGGGGGGGGDSGTTAGTGGLGGGGNGSPTSNGSQGAAGTGGGGRNSTVNGGNGGSGVVIVAYLGVVTKASGGAVSDDGTYTYHTFTTAGHSPGSGKPIRRMHGALRACSRSPSTATALGGPAPWSRRTRLSAALGQGIGSTTHPLGQSGRARHIVDPGRAEFLPPGCRDRQRHTTCDSIRARTSSQRVGGPGA